ncbi:MAG: dehydratase [Propionibacteriaceae bacterium]|jgi:acyl dehydratase|nr:dehydratase [Propionibacteriaceae bacterium]
MRPGDVFPELRARLTRGQLLAYADASGDQNQIHQRDDAAQAAGLPGVVAHGMLTMGLALRAVTDAVGPERVASYSVRFAKPVVVDAADGAEVVVRAEVKAVADQLATVALDVRCGDDKVLGAATVTVRDDEGAR